MFDKWTLKNFKSFHGNNPLPLRALTLICGANSSGKSSVLQSILLIKQTLQHAPASRAIALNGPLVRLGTFTDIENFQARESEVERFVGIGWEIRKRARSDTPESVRIVQEEVQSVSVDFSFDTNGRITEQETLEIQPSLRDVEVNADYRDLENNTHKLCVKLKRPLRRKRKIKFDSTFFDDLSDPFALAIEEVDSETSARAVEGKPDAKVVGFITEQFFPIAPVLRYDRNKEMASQVAHLICNTRTSINSRRATLFNVILPETVIGVIGSSLREGSLPDARADEVIHSLLRPTDGENISAIELFRRFGELPFSTRRSIQAALSKRRGKIEKLLAEAFGKDLTLGRARVETLRDAAVLNENFFKFSVRYLGPLRDEPKPLYPLHALVSPTDVGPKGELTAAVLHLNEKRPVEYIPAKNFSDDQVKDGLQQTQLRNAVIDWLKYLGVAVDFQSSEKGKFGHELRVRTNPTADFQDLTNVGVGVSQVLPIVVTCLLAPRGSTIILEQPELHLHPAVQARLADFFIAMLLAGKQCIIETHGEYLVERLRFRIVSDFNNTIINDTKIYFFEQKDGATKYRDVPLTRYGAIDDWPKDFFDQSQKESERIVMKALERRRVERAQAQQGEK
ncbi:DUF3696 domain-containing protein [Microvirga sp. VF16]|uniref:AAA family ATPase n=1 Tax=Microvirga sp. VF16 TaxID=2807101 RepID=UPI00193D6E14|nr:DUF3696 domain-containing protein [Microvirga sp. VF16]QRM27881.1 DUF3696 domain-containing protein [Microvirga sp. VF16]